jgi:hypothetical protein
MLATGVLDAVAAACGAVAAVVASDVDVGVVVLVFMYAVDAA